MDPDDIFGWCIAALYLAALAYLLAKSIIDRSIFSFSGMVSLPIPILLGWFLLWLVTDGAVPNGLWGLVASIGYLALIFAISAFRKKRRNGTP